MTDIPVAEDPTTTDPTDPTTTDTAPEADPEKKPVPSILVYAYRCPACMFVVTGEYDPEGVMTPGDYFCRTHNEVMHRAILSEDVTVEDAFPTPPPTESETAPSESDASSESPSEAV